MPGGSEQVGLNHSPSLQCVNTACDSSLASVSFLGEQRLAVPAKQGDNWASLARR